MRSLPVLLVLLASAGCAGRTGPEAAAPPATATVTVTATATRTVVVPAPTAGPAEPSAAVPARLRLRVFRDGCGVIRSSPPAGALLDNLTWTFRDRDGFVVLGRNAEGETRYRYFNGGEYTVVLEAFVDGRYAPVSNKVRVYC